MADHAQRVRERKTYEKFRPPKRLLLGPGPSPVDSNIEIGGGLGPLKGKIWRIGLMGETSSMANVTAFLTALGQILNDSGRKTDAEVALAAAAV